MCPSSPSCQDCTLYKYFHTRCCVLCSLVDELHGLVLGNSIESFVPPRSTNSTDLVFIDLSFLIVFLCSVSMDGGVYSNSGLALLSVAKPLAKQFHLCTTLFFHTVFSLIWCFSFLQLVYEDSFLLASFSPAVSSHIPLCHSVRSSKFFVWVMEYPEFISFCT